MLCALAGADIANVCNEAALIAARMAEKSVRPEHFEMAIGGSMSCLVIFRCLVLVLLSLLTLALYIISLRPCYCGVREKDQGAVTRGEDDSSLPRGGPCCGGVVP